MTRKEAIIFKASDDDSSNSKDPYAEEIKSLNIDCHVISVISFEYVALDELDKRLAQPESYSGIIFSSPRVVEAVKRCSHLSGWESKHAFTVGEKTANEVQSLGLEPLGCDAGTGAALADFILTYPVTKPLLMPCGNLATNTIMDKLKSGGIEVDRIVVYCTAPSPNLEENIQRVLDNSESLNYILYFSPSGVRSTLPILKKLGVDCTSVKFGAIGPTTEAAMKEFLEVSFVAEKPTPQHFASALKVHL